MKTVMIFVIQCVLAKMYLLVAYEQICNTTTDMNLLVAITKLETLFKKVEIQNFIHIKCILRLRKPLLMVQDISY